MSVNKFLKQYGMMIGEGTFGALSGGALGTYTAKKGGEDPSAVKTEAALGALVGAGGILGLRGMIAGSRKAKAINQFKKHDARFKSYVDGLTKREDRLAVVQQQLQDHSRDALLQNEYSAIRSATNKAIPTSFKGLQESLPKMHQKLDKRRLNLRKLRGKQKSVNDQIRRTEKEIRQNSYEYRQNLMDAGTARHFAEGFREQRVATDSAHLLGKPQRSVAFVPIKGPRMYNKGKNTSTTRKKTKGYAAFDVMNLPGIDKSNYTGIIDGLRDMPNAKVSDIVKLHADLAGPSVPSLKPFQISALRRIARTPGTKFGYRPHAAPNTQVFMKSKMNRQGTGAPDPMKAQMSEGLRYRQKDLQVRVNKAQEYNDLLNAMIKERKRIASDVRGSVDALYREPRELQRQMQNMQKEQAEYLEQFSDKKGKSITSSFLGLGG